MPVQPPPLALASPVALELSSPRSRRLARSKTTAIGSVAAVGLCLAIGVGIVTGLVGGIGAALSAVAVVAIWIVTTRRRWVRVGLEHALVRHARAGRESERQRILRRAGCARQHQYFDLRELVRDIERLDGREAERLQLEELLDQFVQLATAHQGCLKSLRIAGEAEAVRPSDSAATTHRSVIMTRRQHHRAEIVARLDRIEDDIQATAELIRWVAQRIALAENDPLIGRDIDGELDWRLAALDEDELALGQLTA
jgi:hypothetical protein